jgi:hypothetical protein
MLLVVVLVAGLAYLAYDPAPAKAAWAWVRHQFNLDKTDTKSMGTPNYMPVVPGK